MQELKICALKYQKGLLIILVPTEYQISWVLLDRFWSNFDVQISTSNFGTAGEIPIFLSCSRKNWQLCKDNYSKLIFTTTYDFFSNLKNSIKIDFPNRFFCLMAQCTQEGVYFWDPMTKFFGNFFKVVPSSRMACALYNVYARLG